MDELLIQEDYEDGEIEYNENNEDIINKSDSNIIENNEEEGEIEDEKIIDNINNNDNDNDNENENENEIENVNENDYYNDNENDINNENDIEIDNDIDNDKDDSQNQFDNENNIQESDNENSQEIMIYSREDDDDKTLTHKEIWDDSSLIKAWDNAVEEYEKYHSIKATKDKSIDNEVYTDYNLPSKKRNASVLYENVNDTIKSGSSSQSKSKKRSKRSRKHKKDQNKNNSNNFLHYDQPDDININLYNIDYGDDNNTTTTTTTTLTSTTEQLSNQVQIHPNQAIKKSQEKEKDKDKNKNKNFIGPPYEIYELKSNNETSSNTDATPPIFSTNITSNINNKVKINDDTLTENKKIKTEVKIKEKEQEQEQEKEQEQEQEKEQKKEQGSIKNKEFLNHKTLEEEEKNYNNMMNDYSAATSIHQNQNYSKSSTAKDYYYNTYNETANGNAYGYQNYNEAGSSNADEALMNMMMAWYWAGYYTCNYYNALGNNKQ
ncbi:hypothetical protein BCR32DRAFT_298209 [Anaeromyces robustus]|uniref:Survival Motor Neuron Gemin2-binding domain-containing protein n=1 Tax=Anaeromyces robustus TaxID=1754192 RepID=A0A1Y1VS49_9FUNG|nr:hypothetical protein BCR32DRAFT_298209 [Anaeromyces robustus]|eukprot:ORX64108.1 hypothetical protein BCR32DRAFT_298209 [Anaeromyces robustus]